MIGVGVSMEGRHPYFSTKVQFCQESMTEFLKVLPIKATPFMKNFKFPSKKVLNMLISLSDCLYFLRYWAIRVLQLFLS